ncbi:MAG: carbohydrate binding family 9 domain-containing protein [bacterium]|nr:MAG: carbohydrate binding family 9 domain-containing protein [bacterium]
MTSRRRIIVLPLMAALLLFLLAAPLGTSIAAAPDSTTTKDAGGVIEGDREGAGPADTTGAGPGKQEECPSLRAVRVANGGIRIDGILNEPDWETAPIASDFTQHEPDDGMPATEKTLVRVVFDDESIYVGVEAYDTQPNRITGRLTRRDEDSPSDWIHILFDSYNDKRTGFRFSVNPAGVKTDGMYSDDVNEDSNWDAVWNVATSRDGDGWTAEFSIPFSQLRYTNNGSSSSWGFQVARQICRNNELSFWSPTPRDCNQIVSRCGRLNGFTNLPKLRRLEILPYAVGSVETFSDPGDDPFRNTSDLDPRLGADIKYGITSNMTLDMTINPDFGQVEQDPSEFNLTAYETYFEEKRPFFIEGANLFRYRLMFGDGNAERLFYSRRIGRRPQFDPLDSSRWPDTDGFYEETPDFSTILGAAKVTGRTSNGWSFGVMNALTDSEEAQVQTADGTHHDVAVEPMTNYFVGRAMKDFNEGRSTFGGIVTSVTRDIPHEDLEFLNRQAFTGGVDFSHRWHNDELQFDLKLMGSHVRGSEEAMLELQTSSARYFQRPDAHHLEVDSTLTSMSGFAANLWTGKFAGEPWLFGLGFLTRSPGFEANDMGYMRYSDGNLVALWAGYRDFDPGKILRTISLNFNFWEGWNYGGERYDLGGNVNGWVQFMNYWSIYGGINRNRERQDNSHLRGGPAIIMPSSNSSWYGFETDYRKSISLGYDGDYWWTDEGGSNSLRIAPWITIRPAGRFDIRISPSYRITTEDLQYVDEVGDDYILAHLDMKLFSLTTRFNFTITPEMSLQFYGMPFIAAGQYSDYRTVSAPRAENYDDRFTPYNYLAVADNPNFNFRQFRSNLVFRWEYNPGSTIYFVWSRGATVEDEGDDARKFSLGRDLGNLFSEQGDNTFLIKINKWFSL